MLTLKRHAYQSIPTSMAERFLVAVDLNNLHNSLSIKTVSYLHKIYIEVRPEDYQKAYEFIQSNFHLFTIYCDCAALQNLESIISLLNAGAEKIFVTPQQLEAIDRDRLIANQDLGRLLLSLDPKYCEITTQEDLDGVLAKIENLISKAAIGALIGGQGPDDKVLNALRQAQKDQKISDLYQIVAHTTREKYSTAIKAGYVSIVPAVGITADPKQYSELLPAHLLLTEHLKSDRPDGLIPTVVTDDRGICLGLVYSDGESVEAALRLGCGVYHSRRHGLWIKGQESGNTQDLISITLDCDSDTLLFKVRQKGKGIHNLEYIFLIYCLQC